MGTASVRHNMAKYRFRAAAHYARKCSRLEEEYSHNENRPIEHQWYATDAITNSFSGLEATINEFFQDAIDEHDFITDTFDHETSSLIAEHSKTVSGEPTLSKYQRSLLLSGKNRFDEGSSPYQVVDDLRYLRNRLTHFKPEWDSEKGKHERVRDRLMSYDIPESPFASEESPFFPLGCLGHGGAEWAVESSVDFVRAFHDKLGVNRPILDVISDLDTR